MTPVSFVKTTESYVKNTEPAEVCRLGHHMDTFTGNYQNGPNNRIGPDCVGTAAIACLLLLFRRLD